MLFWITARGWQLVERVRYGRLLDGPAKPLGLGDYLRLPGAARAPFIRILAVILLLGFAVWIYLGNYELLFNTHAFMTGADYVDEKITLPLRWLLIICALAALPLVWMSKFKRAAVLVLSASSCSWHYLPSSARFTCDRMKYPSSGHILNAILKLLPQLSD